MKNRKCPSHKFCVDYDNGNCQNCVFGEKINKFHKRIERLKKQNETLTIQRNAWALTARAINRWISVDERLPERNGRYLTHCNIEGQSLVCVLYYNKIGGFNEGTVTHWMPLPEAPKESEGEG